MSIAGRPGLEYPSTGVSTPHGSGIGGGDGNMAHLSHYRKLVGTAAKLVEAGVMEQPKWLEAVRRCPPPPGGGETLVVHSCSVRPTSSSAALSACGRTQLMWRCLLTKIVLVMSTGSDWSRHAPL